MSTIPIVYFSDVLCVWAYFAQLRVEAIKQAYGERVAFEHRFCSIFGDTARKIPAAWGELGGYEAFNGHLLKTAEAFPEVRLHPGIWITARPASSMSPHLFLKAVQLAEMAEACAAGAFERATWAMRQAFFEQARDIATREVQWEVGAAAGVNGAVVDALIRDGRAHAALASDYQDATAMGVQGSPSFVLNEGRQKLYGNVGYRIIDANIQELMREPKGDQASWC